MTQGKTATATGSPTVKYFLASAEPGTDAPRMTITTNAVDREGDSVVPEGGDFKNFLKNPVLCWVHDYKQIPIGRVTSLEVQPGKGIDATWEWLKGDEFADRVKNAWEQNCLNASSIGFIPLETSPNGKGMDVTKWELLELTLCPIPMNPTAVRAMKSLGFSVGDEKAVADTREPLRAQAKTLADAVTAKGYEFSCGIDAMRCVESLLGMESDEPEQAAVIRQAGQHLLTYLQQEYDECYPAAQPNVEQDAQLDSPLIPMDDDSKYPFVSATGLTGDAKLALIKGINETFSARVKRGRRLSAANEAKLKNAHAHLTAAHETVKDVLDCVKNETLPTVGDGSDEDNLGGDAGGMIALSLADEDFVLDLDDEPRLALDVKEVEGVMDVDPEMLRTAVREVLGEGLRADITNAVQTAVDRARGRVVV